MPGADVPGGTSQMSCTAAFGLPGWVRRHVTVSPTCAGSVAGHHTVRKDGES